MTAICLWAFLKLSHFPQIASVHNLSALVGILPRSAAITGEGPDERTSWTAGSARATAYSEPADGAEKTRERTPVARLLVKSRRITGPSNGHPARAVRSFELFDLLTHLAVKAGS